MTDGLDHRKREREDIAVEVFASVHAAKFYQTMFCLCQECGFVPSNGAVGISGRQELIAAD